MRAIATLIAAALMLTGCAGASSPPEPSASVGTPGDITIGGSDSLAPSLAFPSGLAWTREEASTVWDGDGAALIDGQPLLLDLYGASLDDGTTVVNTFDGLPRSMLMAPEVVGDVLYDALLDAHVGARVLVVAPENGGEGATPPVAMVVDVLPTSAVGESVPAAEGMPRVTRLETGEPEIDLGEPGDPPTDLRVSTLVRGTGAQVRDGSYVTANYKAVYWEDGADGDQTWARGDVFESSWPVEKAPFELQIGAGQVIRGWEEGLIDQTAGSQVLMVVPASYAYASTGALVFVVDILDVWNPED